MLYKQKIWKKILMQFWRQKKKKESQYEEKIRPVWVEEIDLNQEEVLSSSKKALGDRMLNITRTTKTLIA